MENPETSSRASTPNEVPSAVVVWLRQDLRLHDHDALHEALHEARSRSLPLVLVAMAPMADNVPTAWGFNRRSPWPMAVQSQALLDLRAQLRQAGHRLLLADRMPATSAQWREELNLNPAVLHLHDHPAPQERSEVEQLRQSLPEKVRLIVHADAAPMFDDADLPGRPRRLPQVFTAFRQALERDGLRRTHGPCVPIDLQTAVHSDAWPETDDQARAWRQTEAAAQAEPDDRASWHWQRPAFHGGPTAAARHLQTYLDSAAVSGYKQTRNGLSGVDFSSKWSIGLAHGALGGRQVLEALDAHEQAHGVSEGSGWLWFEMLWREHFRGLMHDHGRHLFRHRGLSDLPRPRHDPVAFERWCRGETRHAFVNAGMRELALTGWLSNRMRQIVASYLIHDLACDWRAGAAWFEHHLIDFDVCSNQGNWLYIAGRGTDPRGGRRFNPDKQMADHDADGRYRRLWLG